MGNNHNLTPFKSGAEWNGNRNGRPKKKFLRDDITDAIFLEHKEDISKIVKQVFDHAKSGSPWAMKLVFEYFLTRPKNRDEAAEDDKPTHLVSELSKMPMHLLEKIRQLILDEMGEKSMVQ